MTQKPVSCVLYRSFDSSAASSATATKSPRASPLERHIECASTCELSHASRQQRCDSQPLTRGPVLPAVEQQGRRRRHPDRGAGFLLHCPRSEGPNIGHDRHADGANACPPQRESSPRRGYARKMRCVRNLVPIPPLTCGWACSPHATRRVSRLRELMQRDRHVVLPRRRCPRWRAALRCAARRRRLCPEHQR